jgi:eukaryotic-like serine/threonine-protein kinase
MSLPSGTKLGPYEIQAPLGAGGMGEVYRARDTRLGRDVAVKVLPAHLSSNPELKQRMEREARAISSLNHPHICTLHDIGSQDGIDFLVMEHLEGETLADRVQRGALPFDEALKIAIQIADALEKAHSRGIVHRDLKPANIMLAKNGPKLMDFGLAKPAPGLSSASGASPLTPSTPTMTVAALSASASPLTQKGTVVGTFQYMAPEVLQGAEVDTRSDIFSFGCVLYEMFTGRRAFEGKSQFSVLGAILDKEPDRISTVRPSSPPRLDETVRRCLAKTADQRYGCMHDVRIQLEGLAAEPQTEALQVPTHKPTARGSILPWLVAGIAVLAALSIGAAYIFQSPKAEPVVRSSILPPAGTSFITMLPASGPPVLSPDGTRIAFTARDDKSKVLIYVRPLKSLTAQPLSGTDDATYPFWSPDGRDVGFFAPGKLKRISASGGPSQNICDAISGRGAAWGPDGSIVFTPSSTQPLFRVSAAGGTPEPASNLDPSHTENSHRWPSFLPDGKHYIYWARSSVNQENRLYVGELGSLQAKTLAKTDSTGIYASGHLLFLRDQNLMAQPFNPRRLELSGDPSPIAEHVAINGATARPLFSVSQNGTLLYQTGETSGGWNLLWWDRDGKPIGSFAQPDRYLFPTLSRDGKQLAAMIFTGTQGNEDVWIFDLARGTSTRFTFSGTLRGFPVWSADGKTIYYSSNPGGYSHIYSKAADGSGPEHTVLETADTTELAGDVSPDGRYLVYVRRVLKNNVTSSQLWALPLFGDGKPFPVVQNTFEAQFPVISPDSKWMVYQTNESGRREIYITAFPAGGAKWQVSTSGSTWPKWRKDGKELFFLDPSDKMMAVDVSASGNSVHLGIPRSLFQTVGIQRDYGPYDVSADGKKFLLNSGNLKEGSDPFTLVLNWPAELKK